MPADFPITINAISGYSGGGKSLIAEFEGPAPAGRSDAYRAYGLPLTHKHVPEILKYSGLAHAPLFAPSVGRFAQGMIVEVPLHLWALPKKPPSEALREALGAFFEVLDSHTIADVPSPVSALHAFSPSIVSGTLTAMLLAQVLVWL